MSASCQGTTLPPLVASKMGNFLSEHPNVDWGGKNHCFHLFPAYNYSGFHL